MIKRALKSIRARIGHVARGQGYHVGNSIRGIRAYSRRGYRYADFDVLLTKEGIAVCTHWQRPLMHGFHDPQGKLNRRTKVADMTLAQVLRLRTEDGNYRINTVRRMRLECRRRGVIPCWELKPDNRWRFVRTHGHNFRAGERVMVIGVRPRWDWLKPASKRGLWTIVLWRGHLPADVAPYVDYVKARRQPASLPDNVAWWGPR